MTQLWILLFFCAELSNSFQIDNHVTRTINGRSRINPLPTEDIAWGMTVRNDSSGRQRSTKLSFIHRDEPDIMEMMAGGERYSMIELPDSMVDTTLFVGNLCEFVTDDMLSSLFQEVSALNFVPACVARKANMSSLKYGFVTFPSVAEKEAAIIRFTGYELNNRPLKVEVIQDHKFRVRVPEKLVVYAVGEVKRTRGHKNTMRKVTNSREDMKNGTRTSLSSSYHKKDRRVKKKKDLSVFSSSSSVCMVGSYDMKRGYKKMKRREKRKSRRNLNNSLEDFGQFS